MWASSAFGWPNPGTMSNWLLSTLAVFALVAADVPAVERLRSTPTSRREVPDGDILLFPAPPPSDDQQSGQPSAQKSGPLQEQSKLDLIRFVSGEFAKATKPLPRGKDGFFIYVGQPLMLDQLNSAVANHGAAINAGDSVQITKLEFHDHTIAVDVNGGGKGKRNWRDHVQMGMGGGMPSATSSTTKVDDNAQAPGVIPGMGSTLYLEFKKNVPDMTPDDLKQLLAPFLDFTKQRSASVHWVDTLSPELKKAIQDRRPTVGMDREEVIAAIGKPEHKVRERDSSGNEIEDWIYGQPPSKTVFVRFQGERVTSVRQFPQ
jgi:hypothetical protein